MQMVKGTQARGITQRRNLALRMPGASQPHGAETGHSDHDVLHVQGMAGEHQLPTSMLLLHERRGSQTEDAQNFACS